jgi:hypothetical protein
MASTLPKIETVETPTEKMVRESNPVRTVVDDLGRTIRYKNLTILERARLARVLGEHASNPIYFGMLATCAAVIDIDGDAGPPKTKLSFLETRLEWLKDEGWTALIQDDRERNADEEDQEDKVQSAKN